MNGKHYIGKRVSHIEKYDETAPISGVALLLDENNEILAGDQNGFVLDITCPYGTQEMANDILAKLQGHTYKGFRADNAPLDIGAELGDGVTVDGLYSVLAYRSVRFGPGHFSEIAAPGENELRHEFHYLTPNKKLQRKIASTNSRITKTAEEIMLEVTGLNGKYSELSVTVDDIKTTIGDENSGLISEINQKVGSISLSVTDNQENKVSSIVLSVDGKEQIGEIDLTGLVSFTDLSGSNKKTVINGDYITTGTISANRISGGTLTLGGLNNVSGKAEIKNANNKTLITLDDNGITLDPSVYITSKAVNCQLLDRREDGTVQQIWETNMVGGYTTYDYKSYGSGDYLIADYEIGRTGQESWNVRNSLRGISFGLSYMGEYMSWGSQERPGGDYKHKLAYWRNKHTLSNLDVMEDSLNVFCTLDLQGNQIVNFHTRDFLTTSIKVGEQTLVFADGLLKQVR